MEPLLVVGCVVFVITFRILRAFGAGIAYLKPRWICCDICAGPVLLAQGVTGLATCSQDYLSYKLTGPVLLAQGITGLAALSHSQGYLSCKLTSWSCLLKELLVLQLAHRVTCLATHRPGLACSRDYWSCSPQPLTGLPVLQTHVLVLLLKELLVLQLSARSQGYLSYKLTA
jgi:hypothetical protein